MTSISMEGIFMDYTNFLGCDEDYVADGQP